MVVDPQPGEGASAAAAGMLAPVTEAHYGEQDLLRLNLASARSYPDFVARLEQQSGRPSGYVESGTVVVARDHDDRAALARLLEFQTRLGLDVARLGAREARALEPMLAPTIRGGIDVRGDHQVDNRALVEALLAACENAGVAFVRARAREVERSRARGGRVVLEEGGDVMCDRVVIAAGAWSARIGGVAARTVPVRPVKGQVVHLRGRRDEVPARTIRGLDVYLVSRGDGRVVVGATVEERGFDTSASAGGVYELLKRAYELVPGVVEMELVDIAVGLRPGTPDNAPLIGPSDVDGVLIATGHFRNGILLAPVTARAIVETLVSGTPPDEIAAFSPLRFSAREVVA